MSICALCGERHTWLQTGIGNPGIRSSRVLASRIRLARTALLCAAPPNRTCAFDGSEDKPRMSCLRHGVAQIAAGCGEQANEVTTVFVGCCDHGLCISSKSLLSTNGTRATLGAAVAWHAASMHALTTPHPLVHLHVLCGVF